MKLRPARQMAVDLMRTHELRNTTGEFWVFEFDNGKRRFGYCSYRERKISLSRVLVRLNDENRVRNTILHEIAHALTRAERGHGPEWQRKALAIGCDGQRCYGDDVTKPRATFTGTCPACSRIIHRFRRTRTACGQCCRKAGGGFNVQFLFKWGRS